ncbi:MAG: 50S ribosomal protein L3 [Gammaproteobacteria bacterium]|jgi:large subunit ribosomal protein L3|nr:50S ribosomal protein L3 [Gammaproteobacteria bacterium]
MPLGLIGRKLGMSRFFTEDGRSVPVTVVEVEPNRVTQLKTMEKDGYRAVQVTVGERRKSRVTRAEAGHYAKAGTPAGRGLWEFRLGEEEGADLEPNAEIKVDLFEVGARVDVQGRSQGKGFAGVVKRWGFGGGRATHGVSLAHRKGGSIGQCQDPGRVFPGKKMAGQMGGVRRTQQGLQVVRVDTERNVILISGAVPGPRGGDVVIHPSIKG